MKAYKIFIPELSERVEAGFVEKYCGWGSHEMGEESVLGYQFVREKIHELVQKHAFELGWSWVIMASDVVAHTSSIGLFLSESKMIAHADNQNHFDRFKFSEISWQDFLKLTPEDVMEPAQGTGVPDLPELTPNFQESKNNALTAEEINLFDVIGKPRQPEEIISDLKIMQSHHLKSIQKNVRNEKAWDILKHIVEGRMSVFKNLEDDPGIEKHIKMALRYADEFIRQSNASEKTEDIILGYAESLAEKHIVKTTSPDDLDKLEENRRQT